MDNMLLDWIAITGIFAVMRDHARGVLALSDALIHPTHSPQTQLQIRKSPSRGF
ncbi:MAG: hypothetical protein WCD69_14645 [Xanthobacteraceae bacterium]